jgi:hypothetical protein
LQTKEKRNVYLVRLLEDGATLRVAGEDPVCANILEHLRAVHTQSMEKRKISKTTERTL